VRAAQLTAVPYRGGAEALTDVAAGRIDCTFTDMANGLAQSQAGRVRALAHSAKDPTPLAPGLPAAATVVPGYDIKVWFGVSAPVGTPAPIVARANQALNAVLQQPGWWSVCASSGSCLSPRRRSSSGSICATSCRPGASACALPGSSRSSGRRPGPQGADRGGGPRSVARVLQLLDGLAGAPQGASLAALAQAAGAPKTTLLGCFGGLRWKATRCRRAVSGAWVPRRTGSRAPSWRAKGTGDSAPPGRPALERLAEVTGESAMLAVLAPDRSAMVYTEKVESRTALRFTATVGDPEADTLHRLRRVVLAYSPPPWPEEFLRKARLAPLTGSSVTDRRSLRRIVAEVREQGYAVTLGEATEASLAWPRRCSTPATGWSRPSFSPRPSRGRSRNWPAWRARCARPAASCPASWDTGRRAARSRGRGSMAGLHFEEFHEGQVFEHPLTRTVTEMDNTMFSLLTMNPQPLHIDAHFAAETEWGQRLFNSICTLGIMIGMSVADTTLGTTIGNLGMTEVRFPKPVFHGDTLRRGPRSSRNGRAGRAPRPASSSSSTNA
jgi:acyl dehydratase